MITVITPDRELFLRRDEFDDATYFLEIRRLTDDGYSIIAHINREALIDTFGESLANAVGPGERLPMVVSISTVI
ncbi:MAG: hypothetical protein QXT73_02345 [Candidatus Methanomethylicaceae archaeon]